MTILFKQIILSHNAAEQQHIGHSMDRESGPARREPHPQKLFRLVKGQYEFF